MLQKVSHVKFCLSARNVQPFQGHALGFSLRFSGERPLPEVPRATDKQSWSQLPNAGPNSPPTPHVVMISVQEQPN